MLGHVLFADSYEYLEDQADLLEVDSYEGLLKHFPVRIVCAAGKFKRDRESLDFLTRIGHEGSGKAEFLRINKGFKSNMKTLLGKAAISASDSFEKIACSLNLCQRSVYRRYIVKQT